MICPDLRKFFFFYMFFYLQHILGNHLSGQATRYGSMVARRATTFETDLSCLGNAQFSHLLFCSGRQIKIIHKTSVQN